MHNKCNKCTNKGLSIMACTPSLILTKSAEKAPASHTGSVKKLCSAKRVPQRTAMNSFESQMWTMMLVKITVCG